MEMNPSKMIIIFLTCIMLTLGNSKYLIDIGLNSYIELFSYLLLAIEVWYFTIKTSSKKILAKSIIIFSMVLILFSIGILVQPMQFLIKARLLFSMFVIATITVPAKSYMNSFGCIRFASYGIFVGVIIATLLSLFGNIKLIDVSYEGFLNFGFTGGMQYKNYFAATMLASFTGIYIYNKYEKKSKIDLLLMIFQVILIFISSSRGGYLLFIIFLIFINLDCFYRLCKRNVKKKYIIRYKNYIVCVALILFLICCFTCGKMVSSSSTYMYRVRGVINYLTYCRNDWFHLFFGNATMAFGNPNIPYVTAIKIAVGSFNGTYEMGFINVLIKNGIIGLIGYIFIYMIIIKYIIKSKENKLKLTSTTMLIVLLVSSFVETYVCNIHTIFGVYCYMLIFGICGMVDINERTNICTSSLNDENEDG